MTADDPRDDLTPDQVIYLFERQVNWAVLWVFLGGFGCIFAGIALFWVTGKGWLGGGLLAACVVIGGFVQRLLVLRVRCPKCAARALGRIHSVFQARNIRECPGCGTKLRD